MSGDDKNKAIPDDLGEEQMPNTEEISKTSSDQTPQLSDLYAQLEKEHLYLRAELENMKRQNIKERSQLLRYGGERLAKDLLDTLDNFKSALATELNSENLSSFRQGIEMTFQSLSQTLEKHGIKEVPCLGLAFDPNTQEALSSEPTDHYPEGHVSQVFKAPYLYHDKLLRPGQVIVSRPKTD